MSISLKGSSYEEVQLVEGEVLFREGDHAEYIYLVRKGAVASFVINSNRIFPISRIDDEGLVGEESAFLNGKYSYYAVALKPSVVVKIPITDISFYMDETSDWINELFSEISQKMLNTINVIGEHKIIDARLNGGEEFSEVEEKMLRNALS